MNVGIESQVNENKIPKNELEKESLNSKKRRMESKPDESQERPAARNYLDKVI